MKLIPKTKPTGSMVAKRDKPDYCYESGCPLADKGKGFVFGYGEPLEAKIALQCEAPGTNEVQYRLGEISELAVKDKAELERRKRDYPNIPVDVLKKGAPLVGKSGALVNAWILENAGIKREEIFLDNTLRCLPPKGKNGAYPTGKDRTEAEKCCRYYDRLHLMQPDIAVVTIHPASILREVTPLPLVVKDFQKGKDFANKGFKVLMLVGGKAAKAVLKIAENVTKWRGHYQWLKKQK